MGANCHDNAFTLLHTRTVVRDYHRPFDVTEAAGTCLSNRYRTGTALGTSFLNGPPAGRNDYPTSCEACQALAQPYLKLETRTCTVTATAPSAQVCSRSTAPWQGREARPTSFNTCCRRVRRDAGTARGTQSSYKRRVSNAAALPSPPRAFRRRIHPTVEETDCQAGQGHRAIAGQRTSMLRVTHVGMDAHHHAWRSRHPRVALSYLLEQLTRTGPYRPSTAGRAGGQLHLHR